MMSADGDRRAVKEYVRERYGFLSAIAVAVGILLVLVSELTDAEWTRIFGALAITFGGIGLGVRAGFSERTHLLKRPLTRGTAGIIALVAGALMGLPGVIALVSGLGGGLDGDDGASTAAFSLGILLLGFMTLASVAALAIAARAIQRAVRGPVKTEADVPANGEVA